MPPLSNFKTAHGEFSTRALDLQLGRTSNTEEFEKKEKTGNEQWIKVIVALVLTVQVSLMVMVLRYSKTSTKYLSMTAVILAEALKIVTCLVVLAWQYGMRVFQHLRTEIFERPWDMLYVSIPALLYLVQNNLLFYSMECLEAVVYQVTYQLKILTTAVCMVLMLGKQLSGQQWVSLLLLTSGVGLAQIDSSSNAVAKHTTVSSSEKYSGFVALLVACFISGFASVYTEKLLKQSSVSLWVRNVQLGVWSLAAGLVALYSTAHAALEEGGFFQGYTPVVWCVVILQASSGILVALVVKLADNIIKTFSAAASLLLSSLLSVPIFGFRPSGQFAAGSCLVLLSAHMYAGGTLPSLVPFGCKGLGRRVSHKGAAAEYDGGV